MYTLKQKSKIFKIFQVLGALVEYETCLKVKCLLSNNSGQFGNMDFDDYCFIHGIKRVNTIMRTLQKNVVAEKMNRTAVEQAWIVRLHIGLLLQI